MIDRPTARLILLDDAGRVLLFQFEDLNFAEPDSRHESLRRGFFWCTPGGVVEPGETHEEAARRELWEETGITNVDLGPCLFTREKTMAFPDAVVHFRAAPVAWYRLYAPMGPTPTVEGPIGGPLVRVRDGTVLPCPLQCVRGVRDGNDCTACTGVHVSG